jgi:hypothetical protein
MALNCVPVTGTPQISPLRCPPVLNCVPVMGRTADLSAALRSGRDDKGEGGYGPQLRSRDGRTADLSSALRSGRDDKGEGRLWPSFAIP